MKQQNQNQEFRFNEVLFEHRNKEYGAYALRNESDRILTKALFVGVSLMAAVSITPFVISALKGPSITKQIISCDFGPIDIKNVDTPEVIPPIETIMPVTPPPSVKTYDDRLPEPTAHPINEKIEAVDKTNAVASTQTSEGKETTKDTYIPIVPRAIGGEGIPTAKPEPKVEVTDPKKIETELSVEANFSGGIDSFRNKVMNNFDSSGFESGDVMKTSVTFIVETDGTISGVKANGTNADFNNEAIRTIKLISNKGKWIAAKNKKGESVRSYFKFPISMKFDN
ncbi:energy transducer TonB [Chryseobacterium lactis]|uniref:Energy transducer TonB n=1 Tax=Chryseobacterium lactis TaxID=1241981 RepID=A0A3G6RJA1_CHRLC|nr:energy transducer TonB [Chryseobacterium lactis]AZA82665.1 energy transducer TonB [Chryseobacterium lactis]AZB03047.1 energy transducer TonB [Chryseobacterium lactis]PNW11813.1 energy transducer TonB [Chryseobacterium lactis]